MTPCTLADTDNQIHSLPYKVERIDISKNTQKEEYVSIT